MVTSDVPEYATFHPDLRKKAASPAPMPLVPPVMTAVFIDKTLLGSYSVFPVKINQFIIEWIGIMGILPSIHYSQPVIKIVRIWADSNWIIVPVSYT
jgi:hypothetical protein